MTNLLLIESPGKLKKLSQILGPGWVVKASMGHVRELANDGEDALGFELGGSTIECRYQPRSAQAKKVLTQLRQAVKQADTVYIATDPDREGETIGWHLQQALHLKQPRRVVYSEITPQAVRQAIAHPRTLDQALIAAGRARDCLDKLVGYKGSRHVVWPLRNGAKSMGRVQSATLHLLCQREREIQAFTPQDYWSVWVAYQEGFKAFYRKTPNPKKRSPHDPPDEADAATSDKESDRITTQAAADHLVAIAQAHPHRVVTVEGKVATQSPPPPFVTSTLQQAAGSKLRLSPEKTMKVAQALYEKGHITYMRTDSVVLSAPFCQSVRQYLEQHDPTNVPKRTTKHRTVKGAQEAHEAIRPTEVNRLPGQLRAELTPDEATLYELIWNRSVASQCAPAQLRKTRVVTQSGEAYWEARGQVLEFAGYTRYWNNISADTQLPSLQQGQSLQLQQAQADPKQTQPPPRYTEPKLVQLMERKGIGRPSTYAPTIKTLRDREYAHLVQGKLQPTPLGLDLDAALETLLPDLIQPEFTAQMEQTLDAIATGDIEWQTYLINWHKTYFAPAIAKAQQLIQTQQVPRSSPLVLEQFVPGESASGEVASGESASGEVASGKPASRSRGKSPRGSGSSTSTATATSTACPTCSQPMQKIPSRSKKLKANHFLRCSAPTCETVMFWNPSAKRYERPYAQRQSAPNPDAFTDYPCPVCGALLERHAYTKDGQAKEMLRCSLVANRRQQCKDVAFFQTRDGFWSPKFGELKTLIRQ